MIGRSIENGHRLRLESIGIMIEVHMLRQARHLDLMLAHVIIHPVVVLSLARFDQGERTQHASVGGRLFRMYFGRHGEIRCDSKWFVVPSFQKVQEGRNLSSLDLEHAMTPADQSRGHQHVATRLAVVSLDSFLNPRLQRAFVRSKDAFVVIQACDFAK
jgi:hypothetical protein